MLPPRRGRPGTCSAWSSPPAYPSIRRAAGPQLGVDTDRVMTRPRLRGRPALLSQLPDDGDRARRVRGHVLADRAEQQPGRWGPAAGTHDQLAGTGGGRAQHRPGRPLLQLPLHGQPVHRPAALTRDGAPEHCAQAKGQLAAGGGQLPWPVPNRPSQRRCGRRRQVLKGVDDDEPVARPGGDASRPPQRVHRPGGSVHPDDEEPRRPSAARLGAHRGLPACVSPGRRRAASAAAPATLSA